MLLNWTNLPENPLISDKENVDRVKSAAEKVFLSRHLPTWEERSYKVSGDIELEWNHSDDHYTLPFDLEKQVGDKVNEGETIVVLEAMKMENALTAPATGTIGGIGFGIGDHVEKNDVLCIIST